jgi:hypothetical protein
MGGFCLAETEVVFWVWIWGGGGLYCKFVRAQSLIIGVKENFLHVLNVPSAENVLAMQQSSCKSLRKSTLELVMSQHFIQQVCI